MKSAKKLTRIMIVMLLAVFYSCSNEEDINVTTLEQKSNAPQIENGRLVFKNKEQFSNYLQDEFLMKELETNLKEKGFHSLRETAKGDEMEYADFVLNLYNKNREVKIGSELIFIMDWKQYVVKNGDEELLYNVKEKVKENRTPNYENIEIYNIKIQRETLNQDETKKQRSWVDAKYQHRFHDNGTPVKLVFEAYVNTYYIGILRVDYGVRIKYEWLHGRWWKLSGDNVYKEIRNLSIVARSGQNVIHSYNTGSASYQGPNVFSVQGTFNIMPATSFHIYFSGDFYAQIRQGSKPKEEYKVNNCSWAY